MLLSNEQSVFGMIGCWNEYQFEASWPAELTNGQAVMDSCRASHFSEVQRLWASVSRPTESDYNEAYASLASCLRESGIDVSEHPSGQELADLGRSSAGVDDRFANCAVAMQQQFGILVTIRGD